MIRKVKIKDIFPNPYQPRKNHDAESIKSMADEIGKVGLWVGALRGREHDGHIELCFGHRRLEAVKLLGWKEVDVDVVKLSNEDMALQGLIENLQRMGLDDAERGDGIATYIKLKTGLADLSILFKSRRTNAEAPVAASLMAARDEVGKALNISPKRANELLHIAGWDESVKEPIRQEKIAGKSALVAERIGGPEAVKAAAEAGIGYRAMEGIETQFAALPEETEQEKKVKEKVRDSFTRGKITTPEDVTRTARQARSRATPKEDLPPDLVDVIRAWTTKAHRWAGELDQVAPYIAYIDSVPEAAKRWREAVDLLIDRLKKVV